MVVAVSGTAHGYEQLWYTPEFESLAALKEAEETLVEVHSYERTAFEYGDGPVVEFADIFVDSALRQISQLGEDLGVAVTRYHR
jgi:hypothetical protein